VEDRIAHVARRVAEQAGRSADLTLALADATVLIGSSKLDKILTELVDNAFKFSEAGSRVRVSSRLQDGCYKLAVADAGRGMTPEQILNIGAHMQFGRKAHEQQGSGLGLVITKRLVELHNGRFAVDSKPGERTHVHITLPLHPEAIRSS
jgi:two-component system sensor histidine kinase/response regulator